ncbi:hypothetical protein LG301_03840 [Vreelandella venusta]|uniref:hypothetical protein n=1 Tax=Vreelandella venusta TaxID=44935 RepID=UPI00384C5814
MKSTPLNHIFVQNVYTSFHQRFHKKAVLLMAALLFSLPAMSAQPGPDGNQGHLNRLLHNPVVVQHLGLSGDEADAAQAVSNEVVEAHREDFEQALAPATKSDRVPLVAQVFVSVNEDTFAALESILSDEQRQRLKQIEIQTFGVRALTRPAIAQQLNLEPSQITGLRDISSDAGSQLSTLKQSMDLTSSEKNVQAQTIRLAAMREARHLLTEEQWVSWELLTGADFAI